MQIRKFAYWGFGAVYLAAALTAHAGAVTAPYVVSATGQEMPLEVSAGSNGDQIVLYRGNDSDPRFKRRYGSNGVAIAASEALGTAFGDAVAADRAGNHVVVGTVPGLPGIHARVYNRAGALITAQFRVDESTSGTQGNPVVTMNANGVIAVAWSNYLPSLSTQYVQIRLFNRDGTARSGTYSVASAGDQMISPTSIALDGSNNATVMWQQRNYATPTGFNVWLRRYNSVGTALTNALRANDSNDQALYPHVATNTPGAIIATWSTYSPATNSRVITGQRYDSAGTRVGSNFVISNTQGNGQSQDVGMMDDGSFAVTWENDNRYNVPAAIPAIYAKQFNSAGTAVGTEFKVNTSNAGVGFPFLGMDLAGNFTIAWRQYDAGTQTWGVHARRYLMDTRPAVTTLTNGVPVSGLAGATGSFRYFKFDVPSGVSRFTVTMTGAGDADLFIRFAAFPTLNTFDISPAIDGSNETVVVNSPPSGEYYIGMWGYAAYSNVSLTVSY